ncbi:hypothetical protein V3I01_07970 [Sphingomonas sp. gentR]|uniref:hypothetical protein n=1 Tax=Sphingomonas sp. gentR TaxID=3118768 RepID=UPI0030D4C3FE
MTDPTEIARVAAGLTRAQKEAMTMQAVVEGAKIWAGGTHATRSRLDAKGLVLTREGYLTATGRKVRDHILREKSGG